MEKMTKLTNEELLDAYDELQDEMRDALHKRTSLPDAHYDKDTALRAEILKRMAEGAAGEASPQGDLLAALKAERELCCKDVCACCQWPETWQEAALMPNGDGNPDSPPEYVHTFRPQIGSGTSRPIFKRCEANAIRSRVPEQAQAKATSADESGSATTAGPRLGCPKCGNNFFDVRAGTAYCCDTALLTGCNYQGPVAQFFAAAPAEDCANCAEWKKAAEWAAKQPEVPAIDWKARYEALEAEVAGMEMEERMARIDEAAEDVQLDVETIEDDLITIGRRILNAIEKHTLPDGANDEIEAAVHDLNRVLALLRRVSGKGAQDVIGCDVHPSAPVEGCSGCKWINSPAPVPATPEPRLDLDLELARKIKLIGERYNWDLSAFFADLQATTQGTPEGVK